MTPISEERLRNTRAWAAARIDSLSGAEVIVGAIDELLERRAGEALREEVGCVRCGRAKSVHPDMSCHVYVAGTKPAKPFPDETPAPLTPHGDAFKNFHRLLCERFGYVHDEKDWQRDQLSMIEHIVSTMHDSRTFRGWRFWVLDSEEENDLALCMMGPELQAAAFGVPRDSIRAEVLRQFVATAFPAAEPLASGEPACGFGPCLIVNGEEFHDPHCPSLRVKSPTDPAP